MKSTQRFFKMLELDRKDILYIYLYAIFAGIITLSLPLGIQAIISLLVGGETSSSLYLLIAIITIGTALTGVLTVMQLTVTEMLQRRIFARSSFEFAWRIPRLQLEKLSGIYPPELINRFFDTIIIQKGIPKILIDFSTALLQIVWGLILLALYHPFFVFFGLVLLIILISIFRLTGPQGLKTSLQESKYKYMVAHWLEELGRAMNTFKLSGECDLPMSRTDNLVSNYLDARKKHFRILLIQYGSIVLFKVIITASLLVLGSILVIQNQISLGQFVAAEIIVILILNSVEKLILTMETVYDVLTGLEKIGFVTDLPLERNGGIPFKEVNIEDGVRVDVEGLTFKFEDAITPTIKDISLKVKSGERICIAGYNGAGKSTLAQLIGGLYTNFEGTIAYNDVPFRSINIDSLRKHIGSLSDEEEIFNGSIIENITLGVEHLNLKRVIGISKEVRLHDFVNKLPNGYRTELLASGLNVPRSIRTKIILARTIINQPKLLILENFAPRIEARERQLIINYLTHKENDWTLIAVSNNPSFAERCDVVYILKDGQIIKQGIFKEIKNDPYVQDIFKLPQEKPTATIDV